MGDRDVLGVSSVFFDSSSLWLSMDRGGVLGLLSMDRTWSMSRSWMVIEETEHDVGVRTCVGCATVAVDVQDISDGLEGL